MLWLTVMTLPDGTQVESGMPTTEKTAAGPTRCSFRLLHPDGVVHEFPTLTTILDYLEHEYDADDLKRAANR